MNENVAIRVENLTKEYKIGKLKNDSLRYSLASLMSFGNKKNTTFNALNDVSFEVAKGEVLGIIGRNGAGKSTLLKVLSQITSPTKGRIQIRGRMSSLLEVGTGFHPELTGRENIYLNGTILGMTRKEIRSQFENILAFSGVEAFIDTPVKHYSSGMSVRLAFAVAAHLEPEILVIDEVLAVGDAEFQQKCLGKMKDVASSGRTVLFVSHNMGSILNLCDTCLLLDRGAIISKGKPSLLVEEYLKRNNSIEILDEVSKDSDIYIKKIYTCNVKGELVNNYYHSEKIVIRIVIGINKFRLDQNIEVCLLKKDKSRIFTENKPFKDFYRSDLKSVEVEFCIEGGIIAPNHYSFFCALNSRTCTPPYDYLEDICAIQVVDDGTDLAFIEGLDYGCLIAKGTWSKINEE